MTSGVARGLQGVAPLRCSTDGGGSKHVPGAGSFLPGRYGMKASQSLSHSRSSAGVLTQTCSRHRPEGNTT